VNLGILKCVEPGSLKVPLEFDSLKVKRRELVERRTLTVNLGNLGGLNIELGT